MKKRIFFLFGALWLTACGSQNDFKTLIKNVESYNHDLLFERYEIAAKNIAPESRAQWLESIQSQHLHFAEIEIASTAPCESDEIIDDELYDPEKCAVIFSQVQWYVNGSPSVQNERIRSVWQYAREEKAWYIVDQH